MGFLLVGLLCCIAFSAVLAPQVEANANSSSDPEFLFLQVGPDGSLSQGGSIKKCHVLSGSLEYNYVGGTIGGIAGESFGSITNCTNSATVLGGCYVGGIVGLNYNICSYNTNYGTIQFNFVEYWFSLDYQCVGGIVGFGYENCTITNNTNYGTIAYITPKITGQGVGDKIRPNMGQIVGAYLGGGYDAATANNKYYGTIDTGSLHYFEWGLFGWGGNWDQRANVKYEI